MFAMKKYIISTFLAITFPLFSMAKPDPIFEKQGELIKATYFYENGQLAQSGYFKDGQLHGKWISYDIYGKKTAIANYFEGKKTGKWFFWNGDKLTEVDYHKNNIIKAVEWKNGMAIALLD